MALSQNERARRAREARLRQQVARTLSPATRSVAPTGKISQSGNVSRSTKKYANPAIAQLAKSASETRSQGFLGKLFTNTASDALEIVTGVVPGTIRLGYELGKSGTVDAFRRIKTGEKQGSDRYLGELAKGFKADIDYRWGEPLKKGFTTGKWGLLGERVLEHPLYAVLDVGGVTAVAGKGARVGALASGKLTGSTTLKRVGENSILAPGERLPTVGKTGQVDWDAAQRGRASDRGGVRYREPKRFTETNPRNKSVRTIEVPRAPYSGNPLVRGLQKGVEPLTGKATRLVRETADEVMAGQRTRVPLPKAAERAVLGWASSEKAFNRAQRKQTVRKRNEYEAEAAARQREVTSEYMKALRSLGGDSDARLAVGLHLRGLLKDSTGKRTPQQLRDNAIATWERNQKREGVDLPTVREQIEAIRNLPDEYLTMRPRQVAEGVPAKDTPAKIERAVKEGQKLGKRLQDIQVARGIVSRHSADRIAQVPGMAVHGGSEWAPHQIGRLGDARRASLRKAREIRSKYDAGETPSAKDKARLDRMMEGRREIRRRQRDIKESAVDRAHPEVARAQKAVDESRAAQATASRNPYPSRADARAQRTIEESLSAHLRELKRAEDRHTGHTPVAPGSPFDPDAVYIPTVPLEPRTRGYRRQPGTGLNQQVKQNTGLHIRLGDVNFDPGLLVEQAARVMRGDVGPLSAKAMDELVSTAAYRDRVTNKVIVGNRAMSLVEADENTILMNRRSLEKHLNRERKADDAADFQAADDFDRETFFNKDTITDEIRAQVAKDGKAGQNWIAISKPAYDTWMSAYRAPGKVLQTVDTYTSAWKAGLLAFMPRWYCVPEEAECLTDEGWKLVDELTTETRILTYNMESDSYEWQYPTDISTFEYNGTLQRVADKWLATHNHRWPILTQWGKPRGQRQIREGTELHPDNWLIQAASSHSWPSESVLDERDAAILGWLITDGTMERRAGNGISGRIYQSPKKHLDKIVELLGDEGGAVRIDERPHSHGCGSVSVKATALKRIEAAGWPDLWSVVTRLGRAEAKAMWQAMMDAEGADAKSGKVFCQHKQDGFDIFQFLSLLLGMRVNQAKSGTHFVGGSGGGKTGRLKRVKRVTEEHYNGRVWCPTTPNGTWVMRQDGHVVVTGNTNNTLGLFFQYGIMTGGDVKSLWQATKSPELRRVTPDAFEGATVTRDIAETFAMGSPLKHGAVRRTAQRAYDFNNTIEGFWRRGAYLNRAKRVLKDEGVPVRKLDDADLAKMIDEMPETLRQEALRQAEFFIGDFINLSPFEQNYIRRIIPFYCVDKDTEALTQRGWVKGEDLLVSDVVLSQNKDGKLVWSQVEAVYIDDYKGPMYRLKSQGIDALVTPGHKFVLNTGELVEVDDLRNKHVIKVMPDAVEDQMEPVVEDAFVEMVGWAVTEGHYKRNSSGRITTIEIAQKDGRPECDRIRACLEGAGASWHEFNAGVDHAIRYFGVTGEAAQRIQQAAPRRVMTADFIVSLTKQQRELLLDTMIAADGSIASRGKNDRPTFVQKDERAADAFVMLATLSGYQTYKRFRDNDHGGIWVITLRNHPTVKKEHLHNQTPGKSTDKSCRLPTEDYDDYIWCPKTPYGNFICRRNGIVHLTGNSWWRVAARLTFGMPIKSPGRAEAMALLARAHEITEPLEGMRPAWARGAVEIGGMRVPTRAFSPFATHADMIAGLGNITSGTSGLGETLNYATGWAHPLVGAGLQAGMQRDPFGGDVFSAPLADGIATGFGSNTKWNPVTGTAEDARPSLPWTEIAFKSLVPGYSQVLRSTLAAGESVPETTGTGSLALYRLKQLAGIDDPLERPSVIYEPTNKPVSQPWGGSRLEKGIAAGVGALTGIRPQTEDPVELERRYAANTKRHLDNQRTAVRAYMKQLARARSDR